MALNVYGALKYQYPSVSVDDLTSMCSKMTALGKSTVYKLLKERKTSGCLSSLKSRSGRPKVYIDEDYKYAILRKVHSFYFKKKIPTIEKIWRPFWKTDGHQSEEISFGRSYLRTIKKLGEEGKTIFYLDEIWVNEGHTVGKIWQDKTVNNFRQAFLEGISTRLRAPSGKGRRLIVTHIGSDSGFVDGGLLLFEYINADVFEEYFIQMLDLIPAGSVIVLDDASNYSRQVENLPTTSWRKQDIINWLIQKNITFNNDLVKNELLSIVEINKNPHKKYNIDEVARNRQITIIRRPLYHCELNPIELIWAQVKGKVARKNTTTQLKGVRILLNEALKNIIADDWQKCIQHVKEEEKMWELNNIIDQTVEPLMINLNNSSTSSSE
ncbi:uncharacterized protein LOC130443098 [Diorhabda sublineata]|uniref:uncharacterized protein LOC130443098 n=1 Tax=Diorhabda sublineata TaxID=1163346 RepID=UPI0024E09549|nr:uncharacterized protein LOC130443098 [Diorhabda sublineata]